MKLVSIVIPNWNGKKHLKSCLDAVYKQTYKNFEVIIIDDSSDDGSVEFIKKNYIKVKIILNKERLGFAGSANKGFRLAKGELIATLDNDAIPDKKWLENLVKAISKYKNAAVVEGDVIHGHGVGIINGSLNLLSNNTIDVFDDLSQKFYPGFCSSIMKNHIVKHYYDDSYFFFQAEPYLGWLLRLKGYNVRREPKSKVQHHGSIWRKDRKIKQRYELLNERNRLLNMIIFYESRTLFKVIPLNFIFTLFRFFGMLRKEPWKSYYILKSYLWILKNIRNVTRKRIFIQKQRKVSDDEITKFLSSRIFSGNSGITNKINKSVQRYCDLVGLKTVESR